MRGRTGGLDMIRDPLEQAEIVVVVIAESRRARQEPSRFAPRRQQFVNGFVSPFGQRMFVGLVEKTAAKLRPLSSARITRAPLLAATSAAIRPAGPAPTTSTSQWA